MMKTIKIILISFSAMYLSACMMDGTSMSNFGSYRPYGYSDSQMVYPEGYESYGSYEQGGYDPERRTESKVVVPNSYHVGSGNPTPSKDLDKNWVNSQNPQSYTIELANDRKPSKVAGVLYKAPKNERSAEVKTSSGSYKGLYGSYPTYEAAQEKLNSLPDNVKKGAGIKSWGSVQNDVGW
ncbi:MAG: SPOR domain-containing protein [Legionellaceae bacterium]|nr:SPOR domain-containing protein [Legionellaceae bacterium]